MARFVVGTAAMFALCRANAVGQQQPSPGTVGHDDSTEGGFFKPVSVPSHDKCSIDCVRLCGEGLGRVGGRSMSSKSDCQNACYAHSIETMKEGSGFSKSEQQGKYVQKVMSEYCGRGVCSKQQQQQQQKQQQQKQQPKQQQKKSSSTHSSRSRRSRRHSGLVQEESAVVQKHEQKEMEAYSPNAWMGDPRAMSSGWPSGCETSNYYCQEICQNIYHKANSALGEHFGAGASWESDQKQCLQDCNGNWQGMSAYWNEWCTCFEGKDGNMHLEKVPGLLQEPQELEPIDVGSFMQVPAAGEL